MLSLRKLFLLIAVTAAFPRVASAELLGTMNLSAPAMSTGQSGSFTANETNGNAAVAAGTMEETYSGVTRYTLDTVSGRFDGMSGQIRYGMSLGAFQIFQSFLSSNYLTFVSAAETCPAAKADYRWISIRNRTPDAVKNPMSAASASFYAGGTMTYDPGSGTQFTGINAFDLAGPTLTTPSYNAAGYASSVCDTGTMRIAGGGAVTPLDALGYVYFDENNLLYQSAGGNPVAGVGAVTENLTSGTMSTNIAKHVFAGHYIGYDSATSQTQKAIYMYPDTAGTTFTLYTADNLSDPTAKTLYGTLACTTLESPTNGFCSGTLTRDGVVGTGNAVCLVSTSSTEPFIACSAQKPDANTYPVGIIARAPKKALLGVTLSGVASVAAPGNSTTITATLQNLTGRAIPTIGDPSSGTLQLQAPNFNDSGAYAGTGGSCGSSLKGYESCFVTINYTPAAKGTHIDTFRVSYDNGVQPVSYATAKVIGSAGLVSMSITPGTTSYPAGSSVQYIVTGDYGGGVTQTITKAVTFSSSNSAIGTISSTGLAFFLGAGSTDIGAALGGVSATPISVTSSGSWVQVIGQANTNTAGVNGGMYQAGGVCITRGRLFSSDIVNNRVLVYNKVPVTTGQQPDLVLGQPSKKTSTANFGGVSASTMYQPRGIHCSGNRLAVADRQNHRVLLWNSLPTVDGQAADVVLGQPNATSNTAVNGGITSKSMDLPGGVQISGTKLFVADYNQSRVLVWNTIPTATGTGADYVIGQSTMTTFSYVSPNLNIGGPMGLYTDGTKLYVADTYNNRVVVWNTVPTTSGFSPSFVLGQTNITNKAVGTNASGMNLPTSVTVSGTTLAVADYGNNRVLVWNTIPTAAAAASFALGQANLTTVTANTGGVSGSSLQAPYFVYSNSSRLYVADDLNSRVLVWNTIPTASVSADVVLGQTSLTVNSFNANAAAGNRTNGPKGIHSDGTRLFVADTSNNRVLVWSAIPTTDGQAPSFVLGQPNMTESKANNGGVSAKSMSGPEGVFSTGSKLFVADTQNHRVLMWNSMPTTSQVAADYVLGQANFTSNTENEGAGATAVTAKRLNRPRSVFVTGTKLFVADYWNNRVLVWNSLPTATQVAASVAIGQASLTVNSCCTVTAAKTNGPRGIASDGTKLFISDNWNNRVLIYNTIPTASGASANLVLGQANFTTATASTGDETGNAGGLSDKSIWRPEELHTDGTRLVLADSSNNRVMVWSTIPTVTHKTADIILGQPNSTTNTAILSSVTATTFHLPTSVFSDGARIWTADTNNDRVIVTPLLARLSINDKKTYDFGVAGEGTTRTREITVTNYGAAAASSMAADSPAMETPFEYNGGSYPGNGTCSTTLGPHASCTLKVDFAPTYSASFTDSVTVKYSDGVATRNTSTALSGSSLIPAELEYTEGASYDFGSSNTYNVPVEKTFTVTNVSSNTKAWYLRADDTVSMGTGFTYKGGTYPGTGGTCGITLAPSASCTLIALFTGTTGEPETGELPIAYYDTGEDRTLSIVLSGQINAAKIAVTSTSPLNFGTAKWNKTVDSTAATIKNTGNLEATSVTGFYSDGTVFKFIGGSYPGTGGSCTSKLAVGASCTLGLQFGTSGTTGAKNDTLNISYDGGGGNMRSTSYPVTGTKN